MFGKMVSWKLNGSCMLKEGRVMNLEARSSGVSGFSAERINVGAAVGAALQCIPRGFDVADLHPTKLPGLLCPCFNDLSNATKLLPSLSTVWSRCVQGLQTCLVNTHS